MLTPLASHCDRAAARWRRSKFGPPMSLLIRSLHSWWTTSWSSSMSGSLQTRHFDIRVKIYEEILCSREIKLTNIILVTCNDYECLLNLLNEPSVGALNVSSDVTHVILSTVHMVYCPARLFYESRYYQCARLFWTFPRFSVTFDGLHWTFYFNSRNSCECRLDRVKWRAATFALLVSAPRATFHWNLWVERAEGRRQPKEREGIKSLKCRRSWQTTKAKADRLH